MAEIAVSGLADLKKALDQLPAKIEANIMRGAMRAGSKVMAEIAKEQVPVDSGDLRRSIRVTTRSRRGQVSATVRAGDKKAYYAHMVEFGTAQHLIPKPTKKKPLKRISLFFGGKVVSQVQHPGTSPQPFMRPALDKGMQPALDAFAEYVRKRLAKEAAKA